MWPPQLHAAAGAQQLVALSSQVLGAAFDFADGALEQVRRSPSSTVTDRQVQVHHERVEVISQAAGGGGEPALVELLDKRLDTFGWRPVR